MDSTAVEPRVHDERGKDEFPGQARGSCFQLFSTKLEKVNDFKTKLGQTLFDKNYLHESKFTVCVIVTNYIVISIHAI